VWTGSLWEWGRVDVVSLATNERRTLVEEGAFPRAAGGTLLFARGATLLAARLGTNGLRLAGSPVPVLDGVATNNSGTGAAEIGIARDGTLVYQPSHAPDRTVVAVDREGNARPLPIPPRGYAALALSPDGGRLAVSISDESERGDIWIHDLARGTFARLTLAGSASYPVWTPDGARVAFALAQPRKTLSVFWQNADGSAAPERLTTSDVGGQNPSAFSPDGEVLLVTDVNPSGGADISVLPLAGDRKIRPLLSTPFFEMNPGFSPDGRYVVFQTNESGQPEVYVQTFAGPARRWQVSTSGGAAPRWSRNGKEIFYRSGNRMMAVDVATAPVFRSGTPRVLFTGSFWDGDVWAYDVAPDGKTFYMIRPGRWESVSPHLDVVEGWLGELLERLR
jgi:eukaryotic-like serine/threonine-protein kinase